MIPEGFESDDEDYVSDRENRDQPGNDNQGGIEYDPSIDSNYVDPDSGPRDSMDTLQGDNGMGVLKTSTSFSLAR